MRARWMGLVAAAWMGLMATAASGQSLLEQLEQKVRNGLELAAPKDSSKAADANKPAAGDELPAPNQTPPPPTPATGNRSSASILEPPAAAQTQAPQVPSSDADAAANIYLGLEAESLAGGGIGARVVGVTENSPAWRAGFKLGDVILAIDGFAIANLDSMVERLAPHRPGDSIKVLVLRGGRNVDLTAVLQSAAVAQRIQNGGAAPIQAPSAGAPAWLGADVADLSTAFRNQFGLRVYRAAAVTGVTQGSPAAAADIRVGDAIVAVEGRKIESARALVDWMAKKKPGDRASVTVMRGTRTMVLDVTLAADPDAFPAPPPQPVASGPVAPPPQPTGDLNLGEYADTAVGRMIAENTVPPPPGAQASEVEQLREELRATREQISTLEQRIGELEKRLEQQ
ncbi:MAG: PDZ domain-containing protein [Aureliella sp.]